MKKEKARVDPLSLFNRYILKFYSALKANPIAFSPKWVPITGPK